MTKETEFFLYLLERYAEHKGRTADLVLADWNRLNLFDRIYDMYEIYHCECLENAFRDIDLLMRVRQNA